MHRRRREAGQAAKQRSRSTVQAGSMAFFHPVGGSSAGNCIVWRKTVIGPPGSMALTKRILAIDDDDTIRSLVSEYLGENGFEVLLGASGDDMNRILARETVDLVVLDVKLPGEDGFFARARAAQRLQPPHHPADRAGPRHRPRH